MRYTTFFALVSGAAAQFRGFNYGNLDLDGSPRTQQDFTEQFNAAKALPGTNGAFTSARLFTMIQAGTSGNLISAIQAAVDTDTSLLLGLWGSAGQQAFDLELAALQFAIDNFGEELSSRVAGISIGSEDLYRNSPTGILNESGVGADPQQLVSYIGQVRQLIEGTVLADASLGHVDTWTAWVNGSNSAVVEAVDWLGTDAYPYFQGEEANSVDSGADLFFAAYDATVGVSQGKPVWVTETGWPVAGPELNQAQTGPSEAQQYWRDVSCRLQSMDVNFWWFTLDDDQATSDDVSFSLVNPADLFGEPLFDLTCNDDDNDSSSSSSSTATSSAQSSTSAEASRTPTDTSLGNVPTTLTMDVPIYSTPTGSRPETLTPVSTSIMTTVISDDVMVSTAATQPTVTSYSTVITEAPSSEGETTAAPAEGTDTPSAQTSTPLTFDGGVMRLGEAGGFAAFVAGVAAWVL